MRVCVSVCASVCLSVRGLGGGRFGLSWRRSRRRRRCRRSGPGASRCAGLERAPFCEIYKILFGKKPPGAAATRRPASLPPPSALGRAARPRRRDSGPGDCGICRGGAVASPAPGAAGAASRRDTERAAARTEAGNAGGGESGRGGAGCGGRGGARRGSPRLRLTGGSGASAPPSSRVIVLLLDSSLPSPTPSG